MHLTTSSVDWYAARAAGVVAYVVLTAVVVLGLTLAGRKKLKIWPRFAVEDVHRFGGLLLGTFVAHPRPRHRDRRVPAVLAPEPDRSRSSRTIRPLWVALGIVSAELLLALAIANHYRRRLSYRFWRRTHYLNFVVWIAATVHGLATGTDRSSWWFLALTVGCVARVCGVARPAHPPLPACARRFATRRSRPASGSAALVLALGLGPVPGTRADVERVRRSARRSRARCSRTSALTVVSSRSPETACGRQPVLVRADLLIGNEGLLSTVFQMEYLPSGMSCRGHVTDVQNAGFSATCSTPSGLRRSVKASWELGDSATIDGGTSSRFNPA